MELYWRGRKKENNIDILTELELKAYISEEYAIITVRDSKDKLEDLQKEFGKTPCKDGFFLIYFSPQGIITELSFLLESEEKKEKYGEIIEKFRKTFYDDIVELAKKGNHKRAEMVRIVWRLFNNHCPVSVEEMKSLVKDYAIKEDDSKNNFIKEYKDTIVKIKIDFLRLVMQYAMYLMIWEKGYGKKDVLRAISKKMTAKGKEERKNAENEGLRKLGVSYGKYISIYKKAQEILSDYMNDAQCKKDVFKLQKRIYDNLGWDCSELEKDQYSIFFYENIDAEKYENLCIYAAYVYAMWILYDQTNGEKDKKKIKMDLVLQCADIGLDISECIMDKLVIGVELVMMNLININCINEELNPVIYEYANNLQLKTLLVLQILLEKYTIKKLQKEFGIEESSDQLSDDNIAAIRRKIATISDEVSYQLSDDSIAAIRRKIATISNEVSKKREEKEHKYYAVHDNKEGYHIFATIYMCASYKYDKVGGDNKADIKDRAKKKTRAYWAKRKKNFYKIKMLSENVEKEDIDDMAYLLKYIYQQNNALYMKIQAKLENIIFSLEAV